MKEVHAPRMCSPPPQKHHKYLKKSHNSTISPTCLGEAWATRLGPSSTAAQRGDAPRPFLRLGLVAFHATTFRRAVLNLVQNALDAMPQGGRLTLAGQGTATQVQVQVQDTGSGMPAAQLERIFEPLYTTKPRGTGLGLYIVQEIVAAHAGQLTVQSVEGHGTTFTITLPRTASETPA